MKNDNRDYYDKFPSVLKSKLYNSEVIFKDNVKFEYEQFYAFRVVIREDNDFTPVNANDMKSYFELGKVPRGCSKEMVENNAEYYAISLFLSVDSLKQCFNFPRPTKKLAKGSIKMENGPYQEGKNSHISWWLYENAKFDDFSLIERGELYE